MQMELGRCKKHPNHKQIKGVCPFCLRERLAQVTTSSASSSTTTLLSSSYDHSNSSDSSAGESPSRRINRHRRTNTLLHLLTSGTTEPLRRSRSMAFPAAEEKLDKDHKKGNKRQGRRFWSKLMLVGAGKSKEREEGRLYHSKTIKEKSSSKWAFFSY